MGRARLTLKVIPNERARKVTFMQRSKVLMKKISEFSTLRDGDACLIVFDGNGEAEPMTWPHEPSKVQSFLKKYEQQKKVKPSEIFDEKNYFENRKKVVEVEISKVQKQFLKTKYPTCHPCFNTLGVEQLRDFIIMLDAKIGACVDRTNMLKAQESVVVMQEQQNISETVPRKLDFTNYQVDNYMNSVQESVRTNMIGVMQKQHYISKTVPMKPLNDNSEELEFTNYQFISENVPMKPLNDNNEELNFTNYQVDNSMNSTQESVRINMLKTQESVAVMLKQHNISETVPMKPLNDNNEKLDFTNYQVDNSVNSTDEFDEPMDWASQLDGLEDLTKYNNEEIYFTNYQVDNYMNSTNQLGGPVDWASLDEDLSKDWTFKFDDFGSEN